jgi:2-methylcitrate dehydratase PrpD
VITEKLAHFSRATVPSDVQARDVMALSLLDWAGCAIAGRQEPVASIMRDLALDEQGRPEAVLVGGGYAPARMAALVNGTISHALDYDDTHFAHIGHPSVAVIPAVLALAERQGWSLPHMLDAALIGAEASIRIGMWLGRAHYETGFHQTATAGAFGACLGACRILGLTSDQTEMALGLVATRASGLKSQFGTMGKPMNAGIAASNGVECARLAEMGFVSNPAALAGVQGFGPTHAGQADLSAMDDLGQVWLFEDVSHKFHACCHGLHAMLEAIGTLDGISEDIEKITITSHPRWDRVCNLVAPQTGLQAKFSFRHTAAMALLGVSTARLESFSDANAQDARLCALRERVEVRFDEAMPETAANVIIRSTSGTFQAGHDLTSRQHLDQRRARVQAKSAALVGAGLSETIKAAIDDGDLKRFVSLLGAPA